MGRFDLGIQYGIGLELSDRYLINLTGQNGLSVLGMLKKVTNQRT